MQRRRLANHDTGYVFSDDRGRTWRNNAGAQVARTGSATQVAVDSVGLVVDPLTVDHGLINQESEATDSLGNPHVIISYVPGRFTQCVSSYVTQRRSSGRALHLTRNAQGVWTKLEIPVALNAFGRSQILYQRSSSGTTPSPIRVIDLRLD